MAEVSIPLLLSDCTGGARRAEVEGATLGEIIAALDAIYPGLKRRIYDGKKLTATVALVIDGKIAVEGLDTPVGPHAHVNILPAFGGG